MQAAGDLVGVLVEFSAGMQLRHDHFGGRHALFVDVDRDAATVVDHRAGAVGIERDHDLRGVAGERLVDRIVDDLVDHVMQAGAVVGVADVHARALAHRIEALQDLDGFCVVITDCAVALGGCLTGRFGHAKTFESIARIAENRRGWCATKYGYRIG